MIKSSNILGKNIANKSSRWVTLAVYNNIMIKQTEKKFK